MADSINTHYVKSGFAISEDIVLSATKKTRVVFRPGMHSGGVRGKVIRQKVGADGLWKDVNEVNFTTLPPDCGVTIDLDTAATEKLFKKLTHLYQVQSQGVVYGDQKFVVAKEDEVLIVDDTTKKKVMQEILDRGYSEDFWQQLAEKNPDLATRLAAGQIQLDRQAAIHQFESAIKEQAGNEAYWQKFFEDHPWILQHAFAAPVFMLNGETYLGGKGPIGRQGKGGVATDYLFGDASTKSFAVVDIKTPDAGLVGSLYRGKAGSGLDSETYSMHNDLSGGIVQVRNQITVAVEHFQSVLGPTFAEKINRVHPHGVLLAGKLDGLSQRQQDSFNQFRLGQTVTVITFDELLLRLKIVFGMEIAPLPAPTPKEDSPSDIDLSEIPF